MIQLSASSPRKSHKHTISSSCSESEEKPPPKEYLKMKSEPIVPFSIKELLHSAPLRNESYEDPVQLTCSRLFEETPSDSCRSSLSPQSRNCSRPVKSNSKEHVGTVLSKEQIIVDNDNRVSKGSFAHVYIGTLLANRHNHKEHEKVAVKVFDVVIPIQGKKKYDESEKFYSEWNVLKQLPIQENIIGFIGVVKWDSHMGLVFEYVDHGDLTEYLEKNCMDMELRTCICILCGIAEGINALQNHDPCIIHKDLSSRNILLTKSHLVPKICDFGSAICVYKSSPPVGRNRSHSTSDMNYYAWSTDEYVAPEIWDDSASCSFKSDIYSFGILAMEIAIAITEKKYYLPFRYGTSFQNQFEKIENIRTGISPILPYNVNPVFLPFIRNCINKKPENRPTAQQLVHDLRENINLI